MRITHVVDLVQGELNNKPIIEEFTHLALNLSSLRRGGLFFALNTEDIEAAVTSGAYGVIYEHSVQMLDPEIAWIKVGNLKEAIARLVRYLILHRHIEVFCLSTAEFEILQQICDDTSVTFHNNTEELLDLLSRNEEISKIITKDENFLHKGIEMNRAIVPIEKSLKMHIPTLFDMRIYYKILHFHLNLPALFFDSLCAVVHLCETYGIHFNLARFREIEWVMPIFVDSVPNLLPYGQSEHVLIGQKDLALFREYADYISQNGKWGKLLLFVPKGFDYDFKQTRLFYDSPEYLLRLLGENEFNFGLVLGMDNQKLKTLLDRPYFQQSLF